MLVDTLHAPLAIASTPSLYVVATPLGNLRDISLRALDVLAGVEVIAAEDTRHSQRLLDAYGIRSRMLSLHEHNEAGASQALIRCLAAGERLALITDAGTPAVSDPGARAVAEVRAAGYPVVPVPGASAVVAALSVAGFTHPHFFFYGFLPARTAARRSALAAVYGLDAVLVFYEAPHRVLDMAHDLLAVLGPAREVAIGRELTKQFEESARLPLADLPAWLSAHAHRQRGEFVVCVGPGPLETGLSGTARTALTLLLAELPLKRAVTLAAALTGASRNALYAEALALKGAAAGDLEDEAG